MKIKFSLTILLIFSTIFLISFTLINSKSNLYIIGDSKTENTFISASGSIKTLWVNDGVEVCKENYTQQNAQICYDGTGGAIIVWEDQNRSGNDDFDIYAQRLDSNGRLMWATGGIIICNANESQDFPQICSDGTGAWITWRDQRTGTYDIYGQYINSTGHILWQNGTIICNASDNQSDPQICYDGMGGAIITWTDYRDGNYDIYAQQVNSSGVQWTTNGIVICNENYTQDSPQICSNGSWGVVITWKDRRNNNSYDIYTQRVNSSGGIEWTPNGTAICTANYTQEMPKICSDGFGGAIITWQDYRSNVSYDIYAQMINSNGDIQWENNGTVISNINNSQNLPEICSDGSGGAIITWQDYRNESWDIYAQRINSSHKSQWGNNGTNICNAIGNQSEPQICSDGTGAWITWNDQRTGTYNIYGQYINSIGQVLWQNGTIICNASDMQFDPQICCDGSGGVIITWNDNRNSISTGYDIYAQRIGNYQQKAINWGLLLILLNEPESYLIFGLVIGAAIGIGCLILYLQEKYL
ncbi:MAG: hypothetical protein ACFFDN_07940 [Candidatus Hodarchaeota archaeon]